MYIPWARPDPAYNLLPFPSKPNMLQNQFSPADKDWHNILNQLEAQNEPQQLQDLICNKCKAQPKARKLMTTCHWHWSPAAGCNLNCSEKILIAWYFQEGEITETNHYPAIIVIWKILSFPSHNCIKPWTRSSKINLQYKHYLPHYHIIFVSSSSLLTSWRIPEKDCPEHIFRL